MALQRRLRLSALTASARDAPTGLWGQCHELVLCVCTCAFVVKYMLYTLFYCVYAVSVSTRPLECVSKVPHSFCPQTVKSR